MNNETNGLEPSLFTPDLSEIETSSESWTEDTSEMIDDSSFQDAFASEGTSYEDEDHLRIFLYGVRTTRFLIKSGGLVT